jgi:hypothetical protein
VGKHVNDIKNEANDWKVRKSKKRKANQVFTEKELGYQKSEYGS